jgi:hypothetical protein
MAGEKWQPWCERPQGLVIPVRLDPTGLRGPTRGAARGGRWRRVATGWYLPSNVDLEVVEQRILAQTVRLPVEGGVTAWAALRWSGAAYFDGHGPRGRLLPVPLLVAGSGSRACDAQVHYSWEQFPPWEREIVADLPCAETPRALYDETRWAHSDRHAVVAVDMTVAAGLITPEEFRAYVASRPAWTGVSRARFAADHATAGSRSPQESWMRLAWTLDAGLPRPLCNEPVFSLDGHLLGYPDLFDPVAGLVGEYDGADHLEEDRRSRDRTREERFRDHGLEYVAVVRGELAHRSAVVRRLHAAYRRAPFTPERQRRWTLDQPAWFRSRLAG